MSNIHDATIEVPEDGMVTIDVTDNPDLVAEAEVAPKKEKLTLKPKADPVVDEASAALSKAVKDAEDARRTAAAAEATAMAERRAREDAQRLAAQHEQAAQGYREQAEDQQLTIISGGIETAKREIDSYQNELERAMEAGEFAKASAAQVKLSKAAAALDRLEDAKISFERKAAAPQTTEGRVEAPVTNQFEQYVSGFAPVAQAWLRAHPDCVPATVGGNHIKNSKMMTGHYAALADGLQEGSEAYFHKLEETIGDRAAPVSAAAAVTSAGAETEVVSPPPRQAAAKPRQAQPSAPVSRDPPAADGSPRSTRSVTLTKDQQDAAKMSFPHLNPQQAFAQYARNLIELEAEGKMGRLTH
jgi:hypothetical protein